jgi:hypothetical protein
MTKKARKKARKRKNNNSLHLNSFLPAILSLEITVVGD